MRCILCIETFFEAKQSFIEIFSMKGIQLNISKIILKHFGFQSSSSIVDGSVICFECWESLNSFHIFYKKVEKAHTQFKFKNSDFANEYDHDPIPYGMPCKADENIDELTKIEFFHKEMKVELHELNLFAEDEIIENSTNVSERTKRALKRSQQTENNEKAVNSIKIEGDDTLTKSICKKTKIPHTEKKQKKDLNQIYEQNQKITEINAGQIISHNQPEVKGALLSASDKSFDSEGSLKDVEPEEQYAIIPKRIIIKPKKYKKRIKPIVPPNRMTRIEIDERNARQAKYDEIIAQFFGKFVCPKCNLLVKNFGDMRKHFRASHKVDPGYMTCCGRKFHQRKALADHINVHIDPETFKCSVCLKIFQDSRSLEVHLTTHSNISETKEKKTFQCDKCAKVFTTKTAFEYHSFSKHVPKSEFKFSCQLCTKKLPTARKLKDHMKYLHDPESVVMCDKCGKKLRSQSGLKKHHEIEHSDVPRPTPVPMQCEICGTWLRHLAGLKQHMKSIHEDVGGEHRCHICNKTSTNARALKRHIYHNHECERKFKCTMCEKAFKRPQDLREHTSTHTGEVLYTCPNCPMTFFSNANMYKHRQRLHRAEWEADRKKPVPPNIMKQAIGATVAKKMQEAVGATSAFFENIKAP